MKKEKQEKVQKIKFTDSCPNGCLYCYEPKVKPKFYDIKDFLPLKDEVQILDMNFLFNPNAKNILFQLPRRSYEFVCGIDFRRLDQEVCDLMFKKGFHSVRWAWDYGFEQQKVHNKVWKMFRKAGFKNEDLSIFMLVNWNVSYEECLRKLDLLKVWNVKVNDCCFDGGYHIKNKEDYLGYQNPKIWTYEQLKDFRRKCRKHNQLVNFKIDPEAENG